MKWEILILTMPTRRIYLGRLLTGLYPQEHPDVKITITEHDPALTLGQNRQQMKEASTGEYINFVDDDDIVSLDYVERILPLLTKDYVGFQLQAYEDGVPLPGPTYHSLLCNEWHDKTFSDGSRAWYRDISHLNPMRRELSLSVPIYGGFGEDSRWAGDLRSKGIVRTENYVNGGPVYHYLSRTDKTDGVRPEPLSTSAGRCYHCQSTSTVWANGSIFCNRCGVQN